MKTSMKTTEWREYDEGGRRHRARVMYGIDGAFAVRHNQAPHFSMICEVEVQIGSQEWLYTRGGRDDVIISRHFPDLAPLQRWQLCALGEGPLHYLANALFWLDRAAERIPRGTSSIDKQAIDLFRETIIYGELPVDGAWDLSRDPKTLDREAVRAWLEARLPALLERFEADMRAAGVLA